jgi:hypothetical protein
MIEAWLIADPKAVSQALSRMTIPDIANPESLDDPKSFLIKHSRGVNLKPRYVPDVHNKKIAEFIDVDVLKRKCRSFNVLFDFARVC